MAKSITIEKAKPVHKSMDYEALLKEGIKHIQQYSGAIWTDYNLHDPGITMLEYLCYGLTDIGYRCNFPITDLLYSRDNHKTAIVDNAFYAPEQILPCAALTTDDYRKLIIDQVQEVDNVWIQPVMDQKERFKGLYDVQLQINKERQHHRTPQEIIREVADKLSANRNLCEDIRNIEVLEQVYLDIYVVIELENDASPEQVLADILHELEHFLVPKVVFHSLEEMMAEGADINDLLDGPPPQQGFIKTETLRPPLTVIYQSQIRDTIAATPGVRHAGQMKVMLNALPHFNEEITIPSNCYFGLSEAMKIDKDTKSHPISFRRNNQVVEPNAILAWQILNAHMARESTYFRDKLDRQSRFITVEKDLADIGAYYSIQRFFPAVYGIGTYGLPRDSNLLRKAQAQQLKGFLAVFETMFSSYLQQLTQIRHLFSIGKAVDNLAAEPDNDLAALSKQRLDLDREEAGPTYFARFPFDIPGIDSLLVNKDQQSHDAIDTALAQNTALHDQMLDRRNEFLDHLLARFGESISGDWLNQFVHQSEDQILVKKSIIKTKYKILREIDSLSRERGKAFNYRESRHIKANKILWEKTETAGWETTNVSGLKKRLSYWINLPSYADRSLTRFMPFQHFKFDLKQQPAPTNPDLQPSKGISIAAILRLGRHLENYDIKASTPEGPWEVYFKSDRSAEPYLLFQESTQAAAITQRDLFINAIHAFDVNSRGFFIVEHLLLRPVKSGGSKLILNVNYPPQESDETFESLGYYPMEELNGLAQDLLLVASEQGNYQVLQAADGFFVVIKQNNRPILVSTSLYGTSEEAIGFYNRVLKRMNDALLNGPAEYNQWITFSPEKLKMNEVDPSFYSHRLSVVLPKWPSIFMDQRFQIWFQQLIRQQIPVHLKADIWWLDWEEMKTFENIYGNWLEAKSNSPLNIKKLDDLSFQLMILLTPPGRERDQLATMERSIVSSDNRITAILDQFSRYLFLKPTDLQILEGIDENIEYWLKKEHLSTWTLLSVAEPQMLAKIWEKARNIPLAVEEAESIQLQARLASEGAWVELEQLQRQIKDIRKSPANEPTNLQIITNLKLGLLTGNEP